MTRQAEQCLPDEVVTNIFAYVEREAGRDAPLSDVDEKRVRALLDTDPAARALADDFRALDDGLKDLFDVDKIKVPDDLIALVRNYDGTGVNPAPRPETKGTLIPFPQAPANKLAMRTYRPLAAAAALVLTVTGASLFYQYRAYDQERSHYQAELARADAALAARSDELEQAREEQKGLRHRLASLAAENDQLGQRAADAETARESTPPPGSETPGLEGLTAELSEALYAREQELAEARAALTEAKRHVKAVEHARLEARQRGQEQVGVVEGQLAKSRERLTNLTAEHDNLVGKVKKSRERIAALESTLNTSLAKVVSLNTANDRLAAENHRYQAEASWLNQVAGYHRGYAGTMREVEVSAEQQANKQMLTKWLASILGRDFTVPDLSKADLTFIGGRVFFVNGVPTGQIAYHDAEGRLTGFCFTESPEQADRDLAVAQDQDLNLVSWSKQGVDYVLIGWADAPELKWIAKGLQKSYGDDI